MYYEIVWSAKEYRNSANYFFSDDPLFCMQFEDNINFKLFLPGIFVVHIVYFKLHRYSLDIYI